MTTYTNPHAIAQRRQREHQAAQRRWDSSLPEYPGEYVEPPQPKLWTPNDDYDDWAWGLDEYDPSGENAWEAQRDRLAEEY